MYNGSMEFERAKKRSSLHPKKRIAVIGAGFSGMISIASLKEEGMFEPVCFEKTDQPGGTWCYREESTDGVASIMPTTVANQSKEIGALSNFPPRKEYNNFLRHHELYQYLMEFADSRDVLKHVQYNTEVTTVKRSEDYEETGRWKVTVRNTISRKASTDVYDGVLVCVGHINRPKMPSYPGQHLFKGEIMHTHSLKRVHPYQDKTVVVVGMGCSGLDAAVETSNVAKQVYLSTTCGAHIFSRVGVQGYPFDCLTFRYCFCRLLDIFPIKIASWFFETSLIDVYFNHNMYAIKPHYPVLYKDPAINDYIGSKLLSGAVIQKSEIQCFTEDGIMFKGDSEVTKADVVIMATGYTWKFPFLEEGIVVEEEDRINLYKCVFPPQLPHATLAIVGFILPFGPGFPVAELQCRWIAQILAGRCKLPSQEAMFKDIKDRHECNLPRYAPSEKMSIRVDYLQYCNDIASQFGAKPNLIKLFITDTRLFLKIMFGPLLPYQYRLQGPHSWDGAREAIMTCNDRIMWPLTKREAKDSNDGYLNKLIRKICAWIFF